MYPTCRQIARRLVEPSMLMVPRVGRFSPASVRRRVVFPAPLSPRMAYRRPASKAALTPRSAAKRPNCLTRSVTTMIGEPAGAVGVEFTGDRVKIAEAIYEVECKKKTHQYQDLLLRDGHILSRDQLDIPPAAPGVTSVMAFGAALPGAPASPGLAGAYLEAHFAWSPFA
jgi:hypothetical protein